MRKALNTYHERRDFLVDHLKTKLIEAVEFSIPDGGLAIEVRFDKSLALTRISERALKKGLIINNGQVYNNAKFNLNATRLGFASLNFNELEKATKILNDAVKSK